MNRLTEKNMQNKSISSGFIVASLGLKEDEQTLLSTICQKLKFNHKHFDKQDMAIHFLKDQASKTALFIMDHLPPERDAFSFKRRMQDAYSDIPTILRLHSMARFEEMDDIVQLGIKRVISEYDFDELSAIISHDNRQQELLIEEEIRAAFISESQELLEQVESAILELEAHPSNLEALNQLFRTVHTIKGNCHTVGWQDFSSYVHAYEELLSDLDQGRKVATPAIANALLSGYDHMVELVECLVEDHARIFPLQTWVADLKKATELPWRQVKAISRERSAQPHRSRRAQGTRTMKVSIDALSQLFYQVSMLLDKQHENQRLLSELTADLPSDQQVRWQAFNSELTEMETGILATIETLRTVELRSVLRPYQRLVRDLSRSLHKQVELILIGEDIHIDNTIASVLSNSLIHLIRNSIDHGIETPAHREQKGKPPIGQLRIEASLSQQTLILSVADDGAGIDPEQVKQSAISKALITPAQAEDLNDQQALALIFTPGFSTCSQISNISGRGVGMDMVKETIESVGGQITLSSQTDIGTEFILKFNQHPSAMFFNDTTQSI